MSGDKDMSKAQDTDNVARRPYPTLAVARGFRLEPQREGRQVVSIQPMDARSYWRHDGRGKWSAKDAMYVKLEEP